MLTREQREAYEAKFAEPNPHLPFYICIGVLLAFGAATVIYVWCQLHAPYTLTQPQTTPWHGDKPAASSTMFPCLKGPA